MLKSVGARMLPPKELPEKLPEELLL